MQESHFKLKEVIWEITGKCSNGCAFCGSKDQWSSPVNDDIIKKIADKIALFPPEAIDISGGDPLEVSYDTHKYVVDTLKKAGTSCHIIVNPKSLERDKNEFRDIIALYDVIGLSFNQPDDLKRVSWDFINCFKGKITVITNFNLQNIFYFEEILDFVKRNDLTWQVQYTVYKNENDPMAVYNNDGAFKELAAKIQKAIDEKVKIIISDNMNSNSCPAGKYTLGITNDGYVLPCLSMRSWVKNLGEVEQGNLLLMDEELVNDSEDNRERWEENPLKFIWTDRFYNYRFKEFECCKDVTKRPIVKYLPVMIEGDKSISQKDSLSQKLLEEFEKKKKRDPGTITVMYGAFPPYTTVYSVRQPIAVYYAVFTQPPTDFEPIIVAYMVSSPVVTTDTTKPDNSIAWTYTTIPYDKKKEEDK